MSAPTLCVVFNNVDDRSAIGALCAWSVRSALDAGWRVSVVARDLAPDLQGQVEWRRLYVPPRLHAVQWYAALPATLRAMSGRTWDVVHVQQPQLSRHADLLHLHYLVRAAREATTNRPGGAVHRLRRGQTRLTEVGESRWLSNLPARLELVPVSDLLHREFVRLYGPREHVTVLDNPAPDVDAPPSAQERAAARRALGVADDVLVVGFLGGADPRKGRTELLRALRGVPDVALLHGGSGRLTPEEAGAVRVLDQGYVHDLRRFFAACDVFAAVSSFDPAMLTRLEAAAHGVPVLGTLSVGGVEDMVAAGCALLWAPGRPLEPLLARVRDEAAGLRAASLAFAASRSRTHQRAALLALYDRLRERPR